MNHVFILNPAAGKKQSALRLIPDIESFFAKHPDDFVIHVTSAPNDAARLASQHAAKGEPVRLYACGGDGTLMEVLNGSFGYKNVEIGCIPCGSANDYIKSFEEGLPFKSVRAQVNGTARVVDTIDCNGYKSLNICCMGMDADVADKMIYFKHFPFVTGPMAYNLSVLYMFFHHIGRQLHVSIETENGMVDYQGDYILALAASGQYYGGGYRGAPTAINDDGLLDFVLIETIRRNKILKFLKMYREGKHLDLPIVHTFKGKSMIVNSPKPVTVCVDGECFSKNEIVFKVNPKSVSFVIPQDR
ncbi:MAG TPA: hypothetical protein DEB10_05490 [Ruminococcaceae bacterium]|nr:hypothetical protein [Oscillospiraceae bacterium]HCA28545.1 hypothetical protein [Oscillospiraceae bacterium]